MSTPPLSTKATPAQPTVGRRIGRGLLIALRVVLAADRLFARLIMAALVLSLLVYLVTLLVQHL